MEEMPKIEPGMVIEYADDLRDNNMGLVIRVLPSLLLCYEIEENPDQVLTICGAESVYLSQVRAVYKYQAESPARISILTSRELYDIVTHTHAGSRWQIWRRQAVKEMTVREIEAALGYKVKVIGEGRE